MKKLAIVLAFVALGLGLKAECPPEVEDFTFTDCYGVEYNLFELLDGGQYVFVEFLLPVDNPDATWVKEAYHRYGCNGREMFVMSLWKSEGDEEGLAWLNNMGVECPVVTRDGGAEEFFNLYEDCMAIPRWFLVFPNHEIYMESITYSNMYNVFDNIGIMPDNCNFGECTAPTNLVAELIDPELRLTWTGVDNAHHYHVYSWSSYLGDTVVSYIRDVHDTTCMIDFDPRRGGNYFVVSHCADGSECASETVSVVPTALDFTAIDLYGDEIHLLDILDRGQYVLLDYFYYSCGPCRLIEPNIVDSYYRYGCNKEDIFFIGVDGTDHDDKCLLWCEEFDVQFPTISKDGGGGEIALLYKFQGAPQCVLIAPDHSIVYTTGSLYPFEYSFTFSDLQTVIDAFLAIGIEEHPCYDVVDNANEQKFNLFPNPADGFVNLSVEVSDVIKVYNTQGQMMDSFIAESQQVRIGTSNYSEGLYFVQVDGQGFGKFVVKH